MQFNYIWVDILTEVVKGVVGVLVPALVAWLIFQTNRINKNTKLNSLQNKVDQLTSHSEVLQSFQNMTWDERVDALMEGARLHAVENSLTISEVELRIMVEKSLQSLRMLDNIAFRLNRKEQ